MGVIKQIIDASSELNIIYEKIQEKIQKKIKNRKNTKKLTKNENSKNAKKNVGFFCNLLSFILYDSYHILTYGSKFL